MSKSTIRVLGREIECESCSIDIGKLRYYGENPRISYLLSTHPGPIDQTVIEAKLLALDTTKELIGDIEQNRGLIEEIMVFGDEVVEGNTRLAAYRRLRARFPEDPIWLTIPAKVLPDDLKQEELFFILGTLHLKGKTEWGAYEKAAYIHKMIKVLGKSPKDIAHQFRHSTNTVEAILNAYDAMSTSFLPSLNLNGDDDETQAALRKYSYFEALFRQADLSKRAEDTPAFIEEFSSWVRDDVFPKAADVRELPKILKHKRATEIFRETVEKDPQAAFAEAILKLNEAKPEQVDPFYKKVREFRDLIRSTPPNEVKADVDQEGQAGKSRRVELRKCYKDFRAFCKQVGIDV